VTLSRAGALIGLALLAVLFFALQVDAKLRLYPGDSEGWLTAEWARLAYSVHKNPSPVYDYHPALSYSLLARATVWSTGPPERRRATFTHFTPEARFELQEALLQRGRFWPHRPPPIELRPDGVSEGPPWPPQRRIYGRLRYAGLGQRVVYEFEELPAPGEGN
jgi:hypothetical protein